MISVKFNSVAQSCLTHGLQHARPPCPSPTPEVYSNSYPLSWWCHSITSFSVISHLQSFPASGSFPRSQFFVSADLSIGISASASVLPMNIRTDFYEDWLCSQGTLKSVLQHHSLKASILPPSAFFIVQLSHPYMTTAKTIALTRWTFVGKVMSAF